MEANGKQWVVKDPTYNYYWPSAKLKKIAWVSDKKIYEEANVDPIGWWAKLAGEGLSWQTLWTKVYVETKPHSVGWFVGAKLNISYNICDRYLPLKADKVAIYWEPEDNLKSKARVITYAELYSEVNRFANVLKSLGVCKGDTVGIYLPMIPETIIAMVACTRIGAIHAVVFSAFSKLSLKERMSDSNAKVLITADGYCRRGKDIDLKTTADGSLPMTSVEKVVVVRHLRKAVPMQSGRDFYWDELMAQAAPECPPEPMDSEDPLFILYTSGTTGRPKGIVHHSGGYAVSAYWTTKWNFNLHDDDVYFCTADFGWITGHTYNCYGPLLNAATLVIYEGALDYPTYDRWWEIVERYRVTIFYTSPTAIRMMKRQGDEFPKRHNLTTLRVLASVGEPINEDAWRWFFEVIGGGRCPIIDTWWQTETGSVLINSLPGIGPFVPGVAGRPFPGIRAEVMSENIAPGMIRENGLLLIQHPFPPSIFRTIYKDPTRYQEQFRVIGGEIKYFSNDGAMLYDELGNIKLTGRMDDVMKVAGHALSTAELENALCRHPAVAEAAVIPHPDPIKLEVPYAFIILKGQSKGSADLEAGLKKKVDELIGPIARPEKIYFVNDLPKTRSGKIMRRMLKDLVRNQSLGDVTTLMNPDSINEIRTLLGIPQSPHKGPAKADFFNLTPPKKFCLEDRKDNAPVPPPGPSGPPSALSAPSAPSASPDLSHMSGPPAP
jgi:acetyl-CoA synthetase